MGPNVTNFRFTGWWEFGLAWKYEVFHTASGEKCQWDLEVQFLCWNLWIRREIDNEGANQ